MGSGDEHLRLSKTAAQSDTPQRLRPSGGPVSSDTDVVKRFQHPAGNHATAMVLQRDKQTRHAGVSYVGTVEQGFEIGGISPGQATFASRMMSESGRMAEDLLQSGALGDLLLKHVAPDLSGVAVQERVVGRAQKLWENQKSGWLPSVDKTYQFWADACTEWLSDVAADKRQLQIYAHSFNAFVPRANAFFISAARLGSMQALLGATSNEALVAAVSAGLADATAVATRYQEGWEAGNVRQGMEKLDMPAHGATVEAQAEEVTLASEQLSDAYLDFRIAMTGREIAAVEEEGKADQKRLADINEVKKFVREVGGAIDTSMAVVSGAPGAITNVSSKLQKAEAQISATRNRREIMRGGKGTHNPTYLTTDEKGNMVVANAQTGMQRGAGEKVPIPEGSVELPTSVEKLLGGITDFIYAREVRDINIRLQGIANRVAAIQNWAAGARITAAVQKFQTALNQFAKRCNDLQQAIADRRKGYLDLGIQLDRYARAHPELKRQGLGVAPGRERYATIMTVAAQIREVLALGRNAAGGFGGDAHSFAVWVHEASEHRRMSAAFSHPNDPMASPPFWIVPSYELTPGEQSAIGPIFAQLRKFENISAQVEEIFRPVDDAAGAMFTNEQLSPGGGSGGY